jgi:hypothetical protein
MPRNKSVSFSEYIRRLTEERMAIKLGEVTPEVIHEKMDQEGVQFKVTVPEAMRNYWQAQHDDDPQNDTAMRITFIASSKLTLVDGFDYDESDHVFTLASVEADRYAFDLPYGLEIRTAVEIEAMPASLRRHCENTSFHVEVYNPKVTENIGQGVLTEQEKALRYGFKSTVPTPREPHTRAVKMAFDKLTNPNNEEVYNWIKSQAESGAPVDSCFNHLDFEGDGICPFPSSTTLQDEIIFKSKNKMVTKQRFQDMCDTYRKKI